MCESQISSFVSTPRSNKGAMAKVNSISAMSRQLVGKLAPLNISACPYNKGDLVGHSYPDHFFLEAVKEVIISDVIEMCQKHCEGCAINHPSQVMHFHLMAEPHEMVTLYFDEVFQALISEFETSANRVWDILQVSLDEEARPVHRLKYLDRDWFVPFLLNFKTQIEKEVLENM